MKPLSVKQIFGLTLIGILGTVALCLIVAGGAKPPIPAKQKPVLTVTTTRPQSVEWPVSLSANGSIAAWQEAIVGAELNGVRLAEVLVNVGDMVERGQLLARFSDDGISAEVTQQKAAVAEARAALSEAQSNAERARLLVDSGALSAQQINQYTAAKRSAQARFVSAYAKFDSEQIRLEKTRVVAPDDGAISASSATIGGVAQQGQELFRLICKNRLEWRAEVAANDLLQIKEEQLVRLVAANGVKIDGRVRMIAPTVNSQTRNAVVYVDLPPHKDVRAGMFATGKFELGRSTALTVSQAAVVMRDGFSFIYVLGRENKVEQKKVTLGRRIEDRIEVIDGVSAATTLVAQGAGFLADGDTVRVVAASAATLPGSAQSVTRNFKKADKP